MRLPSFTFLKTVPLIRFYNDHDIATSISYLPVVKSTLAQINDDLTEYKNVLAGIKEDKLKSDVTLKLHQFGIHTNRIKAEDTVEQVIAEAARLKNFVWIDMEQKNTVDQTIAIFKRMRAKYGNVGICLQAYLKRSKDDMKQLLKKEVPMRLVKGFYKDCDFATWAEVTENYSQLMEFLLLHSERPAIATHDLLLQAKARKIITDNKLRTAELQFFWGARDHLAIKSAEQGFNTRVYVPYGRMFSFFISGFSSFDNFRQLQRALHCNPVV